VCSLYVPNASPRAQRTGILNSRLGELVDFNLAVDCMTPGCLGERAYPIAALAQLFGSSITVADVLHRVLPCARQPGDPRQSVGRQLVEGS
jgi:hypothetical protein